MSNLARVDRLASRRAVAAVIAAAAALLTLDCRAHVETAAYVTSAPQPSITVLRDDEEPYCLDTFQPALAPYGAWVDDNVHGLVWVPSTATVGPGFTPYLSGGRWAYTSDGYIFLSDQPWGWITFHYGRWVQASERGWVWVPGARYAPSWVEWRLGAGHVGWAPRRPTWRWRGRVAYAAVVTPAPPMVFVPTPAFLSPSVGLFVAPPIMQAPLLAATTRWVTPQGVGFEGPPPRVLGIARSHAMQAMVPPPPHVHLVPWGRPLIIAPLP